jgi:hypothetical protein
MRFDEWFDSILSDLILCWQKRCDSILFYSWSGRFDSCLSGWAMRVGNASRRCDDRSIRFTSIQFSGGGRSDVIRFDSILGEGYSILGVGDAGG